MKYKVGDKVRIQPLEWYQKEIEKEDCYNIFDIFWCSHEMTISKIEKSQYLMEEDGQEFYWTDEMIEGLVEEENEKKLSDESWRYKNIFDSSQYPQSFECPEGYIFKDENGNVINATKIVLEKKKKEYPKTYCECKNILGLWDIDDTERGYYKADLIDKLQMLLICRDAYWKIAGEEMGLSGSWKPDFASCKIKYAITYYNNVVSRYSEVDYNSTILVFPTEEMRDAFYENFKKDIEFVKELL